MTGLLLWARAIHFGSGMILVAVVAFRWLVLLPSFTCETGETWLKFTPLFRKLNVLFIACGVLVIISGAFLFWAVAAEMSETSLMESLSPETLGTVFFQTQFGFIFEWRIGLAVILVIMMARLVWNNWYLQHKSSLLERIAGFVAVALVVSIAWTGHAAATGGAEFRWRVLADATHLFAASVWPTGLLPFALFLANARQIDTLSHLEPVVAVARRFSTVSFLTVGVLMISGIINAYFIVGSFSALIATEYGRLLCLKLTLFFVILGIAAWNRYRLLPLLFAQVAKPDKNRILFLLQSLQGFVMSEFGLAMAIVLVVSLLGTTPPPR